MLGDEGQAEASAGSSRRVLVGLSRSGPQRRLGSWTKLEGTGPLGHCPPCSSGGREPTRMSQALLGDCLLRQPEAKGAVEASSRGGRLGEGQHGELGYSRCSLYLLDFSNWHRGDLNPSQSLQKAKPSPLLQSSTCAPLSSHHAPSPRHHPPPRMTPRSCSFCPTPSLAWLICCHSAWFTGKNKGFGVRKAQHTLTSGVTLGKLL